MNAKKYNVRSTFTLASAKLRPGLKDFRPFRFSGVVVELEMQEVDYGRLQMLKMRRSRNAHDAAIWRRSSE